MTAEQQSAVGAVSDTSDEYSPAPAPRLAADRVADLVGRAAAGDRAAWDAIVTAYSGLLWAVSRSFRLDQADAAEVVQTTWLRLLENLERIREPEHLGGWLATTARREAIRLLRLKGREVLTESEPRCAGTVQPVVEPAVADPAELTVLNDRDRRLWQAFGQLPERCQRLLRLLFLVAPPYAEVAAALDMKIGSIGPTRARCLGRLRHLLAGSGSGDAVEVW